jgi:hypothetical protein
LIVGKKKIKLLFDVRLQQTKKIQGTVLTGNAQNKLNKDEIPASRRRYLYKLGATAKQTVSN